MKQYILFILLTVPALNTFAQPAAPEGYKWVVNERFSDEFDGDHLDTSKWHDRSPYWVNGRPPATFRAYSVSVKDGKLQIRNSVLKGDKRYNIAGGAVASVARDALYGYYEASMKASSISMSSTFWMKNKPVGDCPRDQQELNNDEINTTYYDWVRSWELVPIGE